MALTDPRFKRRIGGVAPRQLFPEWTEQAACAGRDITDWYRDDVADKPELVFPEGVWRAAKVCWTCPVRPECIAYAFEIESQHLDNQHWWSGEPIEEKRRFGVFGGLPGRVRERLASRPDRLEAAAAWLASVARSRRWAPPDLEGKGSMSA